MPGFMPGIHVLVGKLDVDGRDKPAHDELGPRVTVALTLSQYIWVMAWVGLRRSPCDAALHAADFDDRRGPGAGVCAGRGGAAVAHLAARWVLGRRRVARTRCSGFLYRRPGSGQRTRR